MEGIGMVLVFAYCALAIFAGYRVLSGKSEWLDKKAPVNAIVKFWLCVIVGGFIGGFYLIFFIFHWLVHRD